VIGVLMGALLGIPALRLSGVQFAIASIVFASAASSWLFELPSLPRNINRGTLFSIDLFDTNHVFVIMLIVSAALFAVVWAVRRSSWWVLLIASRDIPLAVQHFGARPGVVRLGAFTLASFIATLGGAFFGIIATSFSPFNFSLVLSIALLLYAVVGGLETLLGPFVAALAFGLLPQLLQQQSGASATTWPDVAAGALVIALLALRPSGLAALLWPSAGSRTRRLVFGRFDAVVPAAVAETDGSPEAEARANQTAEPTPRASRPASVPAP
jgi:branched-chain amino acid transport system permease protein